MTDYDDLIQRLLSWTETGIKDAVVRAEAATALRELVAERDRLLLEADPELPTIAYLVGAHDWKVRAEKAEADLAAVEAEAAFAADDEAELAEVAEKARAMENIPPPEYFQALLDGAQAVRAALDGDVFKKCANCVHHNPCRDALWAGSMDPMGCHLFLPWQPKSSVCPTCGGSGEDDSRPLGEPCRSCTGHIRENNPIRCAECSPTAHQNYERSLWQEGKHQ